MRFIMVTTGTDGRGAVQCRSGQSSFFVIIRGSTGIRHLRNSSIEVGSCRRAEEMFRARVHGPMGVQREGHSGGRAAELPHGCAIALHSPILGLFALKRTRMHSQRRQRRTLHFAIPFASRATPDVTSRYSRSVDIAISFQEDGAYFVKLVVTELSIIFASQRPEADARPDAKRAGGACDHRLDRRPRISQSMCSLSRWSCTWTRTRAFKATCRRPKLRGHGRPSR